MVKICTFDVYIALHPAATESVQKVNKDVPKIVQYDTKFVNCHINFKRLQIFVVRQSVLLGQFQRLFF